MWHDGFRARAKRFLRVGGLPHHALAPFAAEQFDRIAIVDMAELSLIDAVAAELLQPAREAHGGLARDAELQVFLPHPAPAIGAGESIAPGLRIVGAAAMPQRRS